MDAFVRLPGYQCESAPALRAVKTDDHRPALACRSATCKVVISLVAARSTRADRVVAAGGDATELINGIARGELVPWRYKRVLLRLARKIGFFVSDLMPRPSLQRTLHLVGGNHECRGFRKH